MSDLAPKRYTANRDRDTKGLVLCAAITEQSEPGVARAEGIAQIILIIKTSPKSD